MRGVRRACVPRRKLGSSVPPARGADVVADVARAGRRGLYILVRSFLPGFASGRARGDTVALPSVLPMRVGCLGACASLHRRG